MANTKKTSRTCVRGHTYYKSSECPTCPICEAERRPNDGFLSIVSAPARRALQRAGIATRTKLSKCSESEILKLHGVGPSTIPKLRQALRDSGLKFKT